MQPSVALKRQEQQAPAEMPVLSPPHDIIRDLYPLREGQKILVVTNIEDEEVGGDVGGLDRYVGRAMGALSEGCVLVVNRDLAETMIELRDNLVRTGVIDRGNQPKIIGIDMADQPYHFQALKAEMEKDDPDPELMDIIHQTRHILPFIHSASVDAFAESVQEKGLAPNLQHRYQSPAVERLNNKADMTRDFEWREGASVPKYFKIVHNRDAAVKAYEELCEKMGESRLVCKIARSASGQGVEVVNSVEELKQFFDDFEQNNPQDYPKLYKSGILIEECIHVVSSPGVVLFMNKEHNGRTNKRVLGVSGQIKGSDGKTHKGNISPLQEGEVPPGVWSNVDAYAERARELGIHGFIGLDCLVDEKGNAVASDPNGRFTGSTHALLIMHNLYGDAMRDDVAWLSDNNFIVPEGMSLESFNQFLGDMEYSREKGGVIVANHATNVVGKVQLIFVAHVDPTLPAFDRQRIVQDMKRDLEQRMLEERLKHDLTQSTIS